MPTNQHYIGPSEIELGFLKKCLGLSLADGKNVRKMHIFSKLNTCTNTSVYIYIDKQQYSVQNLYTKKTNINIEYMTYLQKKEKNYKQHE